MISHLRLATANPSYRPPSNYKGAAALQQNRRDRTSLLQQNLKGLTQKQARGQAGAIHALQTGNIPTHHHGRGHLEGSCVAKGEGLLQTKSQKRKGRNRDEMSDDDDGCDMSDEEEEEEEKKVWKSVSGLVGEKKETKKGSKKGGPPSQLTTVQEAAAAQARDGGKKEIGLGGLEGDIKSLTKEELDWSKTSKYGKKSNKNFQSWLDEVAKKMHEQQVEMEDVLFTNMQ